MPKNKKSGSDSVKNKKGSYGGQALIEGLMMRGPEKSALAVRPPDGEIVVEVWKTYDKPVPKICKFPLIRGVYGFVSSMKIGYKCLMRSAELSIPELDENGEIIKKPDIKTKSENTKQPENKEQSENSTQSENPAVETTQPENLQILSINDNKKEKKSPILTVVMIIGTLLGVALSIALFMYLPSLLFSWFEKLIKLSNSIDSDSYLYNVIRSTFEGVLKIILFLLYIIAISFTKDIKRTFKYHGAEHKTIFCYEADLPLTVENVKAQKRLHPRCGTSFMIILMIVGIIIGTLIPFPNPIIRTIIRIAILPITVGVGYEVLRFAGRHNNSVVRFFTAPGLWMQKITTKEPDEKMIECAIAAMKAVIPTEQNSGQTSEHPTNNIESER